jgi:arabinogalactan oligomer/maltooligosaccharide transport system substrate-binding protein
MGQIRTCVLGAASALLLAACAGGGSEPVASASGTASGTVASASPTASVLVWADPTFVPALEQAAAAHLSATRVEVLIQPKTIVETRDQLPVLGPQGQGPDLLVGQSDWVGTYVDSGLLAPLALTAQASRFRPVSVAAFRYNQQDYGVPISTENLALLRNTDLAPDPPQTIEQMADEGLRLKKAKDVDLPIALPVGANGDPLHWYPLYSASGGYLFSQSPDGSYTTESLGVGEAGSIRAAQDLADLTERGVLEPEVTVGDATEAFTAGRAAYLISGPWAVEAARDAGVPLSVEAIPGFASTTRPLTQSLVSAQGFLLSAFARNRAAAQEFLSTTVMTTQTMDALFAASGQVPAWSDSFAAASADPVIKAFGEFADASVPMPNLSVMADVWVELGAAEVEVMTGAKPARTMRAAGAAIQSAIDAG